MNKTFSSWKELLCSVPQESVLRPILFNIYLNNLFLFLNKKDLYNFVDDSTPFVYHKNLAELSEKLGKNSEFAVHWFKDNYMKRSSRTGVFCKNSALRHFTALTEKHLCQSLFFNKVVGLGSATLFKKIHWHRCFPVNFAKIFTSTSFNRTPLVAVSAWN